MLRRSRIDDDVDEPSGAPRVLVVNDEVSGCELVSRVLEASTYDAVRAQSHNDAMLALNKAALPVSAVVVDFTSGGTSASLKLLDSMRHGDEGSRNVPVIILSASAANRLFAFQSGADGFLVRPFHANDLVAELRTVLGRSPEGRDEHRRAQLQQSA